MGRTKKKLLDVEGAVESWYKLVEQQPLLPFVVPSLLFLWAVEKWFFSLSNWVLLACAVWATIQVRSSDHRLVFVFLLSYFDLVMVICFINSCLTLEIYVIMFLGCPEYVFRLLVNCM